MSMAFMQLAKPFSCMRHRSWLTWSMHARDTISGASRLQSYKVERLAGHVNLNGLEGHESRDLHFPTVSKCKTVNRTTLDLRSSHEIVPQA